MKCFTLLILFLPCVIQAQGFNNNYPVDQTDLKFLFEQNKLEPFKFYFKGSKDSAANIIIEEYNGGKLKNTINVFEKFKPVISMGDEPMSFFFPKLNDTATHWIRFYSDERIKDTLSLWFKTDKLETRFSFNTNSICLTAARTFDDIPLQLSTRQRLVVFYGNKDATLISCPGDASVKDIVKMYDFVVMVYAEPLLINRR
jgi:hypothetical protein